MQNSDQIGKKVVSTVYTMIYGVIKMIDCNHKGNLRLVNVGYFSKTDFYQCIKCKFLFKIKQDTQTGELLK